MLSAMKNNARVKTESQTCGLGCSAYVYEIVVDHVTRHIGKGRNGRLFSHVKAARCTAKRCGPRTGHLHPFFHRKLVESLRAGSIIRETIIVGGLTDAE